MKSTCGICTPGLCPHGDEPAPTMVVITRNRLTQLELAEKRLADLEQRAPREAEQVPA